MFEGNVQHAVAESLLRATLAPGIASPRGFHPRRLGPGTPGSWHGGEGAAGARAAGQGEPCTRVRLTGSPGARAAG